MHKKDQISVNLLKFNKPKERQALFHLLMRTGTFSPIEASLLMTINSFSTQCTLKLSMLALNMQRSKRTVQRAIRSLEMKGVIRRRYGPYKRIILSIVSLENQKRLFENIKAKVPAGLQVIKSIIEKQQKKFRRAIYTPPASHLNKEQNNLIQELTKPAIFTNIRTRLKTDMELNDERNRQINELMRLKSLGLIN